MRLLNVHTLEFRDTLQDTPPPYAIASHRWRKDELTYQEVRKRRNLDSAGRQKLDGFINFIKRSVDVDWLWIDTCCIDKRDKTELEYAINSMFAWYGDAQVCLAYLHDVPSPEDDRALGSSEWFRRGWTLQELLAPRTVVFLSADWQVIGHKGVAAGTYPVGVQLNETVSHITAIPGGVLRDYAGYAHIDAAEKLRWMDQRQTTLPEDRAHCLLGLLDVSMRISYGGVDAGQKAMNRLMAKLSKKDRGAARSTQGDAIQPLLYQVDTSKSERQVSRVAQHLALGQLAEQADKVARHLKSTEGHDIQSAMVTARLIASCGILSAQLRNLAEYRDRGIVDMPLFMQCIEICAINAFNVRNLFERIIACADNVLDIDGGTKADMLHSLLLEDIEQVKMLLHFALQTYHDTRVDIQGMRLSNQPFSAVLVETQAAISGTPEALQSLAATNALMLRRHRNKRHLISGEDLVSKRRHGKPLYQASLRMSWLFCTIWDIAVTRSQQGWLFQLLTSYEVSINAPIFLFCRRGNVEGMQQLVSSGSASLRDRAGPFSLLAEAAMSGQIDVCRYLLRETEWSDQETELRRALFPCFFIRGRTGAQRKALNEDIYRLFIEQYGLDVDLDNSEELGAWWFHCPTGSCLDIILNNMSLPWSTKSIDDRFRHATKLYACSAKEFLHLVGLASTDGRWSSRTDEKKQTVLHYLARRLSRIINFHYRDMDAVELDPDGLLREWQCVGADLMTTGLDVNATATDGKTAFMSLVAFSLRSPTAMRSDTYCRVDHAVQLWRRMIELSNLDMQDCVRRENEAMKSLTMSSSSCFQTQVLGLDDSSYLPFWTVKILRSTTVYVWSQMLPLPGAFAHETEYTSCSEFAFTTVPDWHGPDKPALIKSVMTRPALIDTRHRALQSLDALPGLIETTQDDAGLALRLFDRSTRRIVYTRRSRSTPPAMHRSKEAYYTTNRSSCHPWLPPYHLCPRDGNYRCNCAKEEAVRPHVSLHSCIRDDRPLDNSQGDPVWLPNSFIDEMRDCQKGVGWINDRLTSPAMRHTFKADCPQGCGRVDMGKLQRDMGV